jgi:hypothetical protein
MKRGLVHLAKKQTLLRWRVVQGELYHCSGVISLPTIQAGELSALSRVQFAEMFAFQPSNKPNLQPKGKVCKQTTRQTE